MSLFSKRCKSIAPWYDYRCQRRADHLGAHTNNDKYRLEAVLWFTCVECSISTNQSDRVCIHCKATPVVR